MVESLKLAFMDFDGTLAHQGVVVGSVREGITNLHTQGVSTTVATGKAYSQLNLRVGTDLSNLVSTNLPVSVESGGRLIGKENRNLIYHPLSLGEIETVRQVVTRYSDSITAVQYQPENPDMNMIVWSPNNENLQELIHKDLAISDIVNLSTESFFKKVASDKPCMIVIAAKESGFEETFPKGLNVVTNEGVVNINAEAVNKGVSLIELNELTGISLPSIMVAGNDQNDLPLMNSNAGLKIWIGNVPEGLKHNTKILNFSEPESFGEYLTNLKFER